MSTEAKAANLVVTSKVKKHVKEAHGMSVGKDAIEAVSAKVAAMLEEGVAKAKADKRKTVKARDIE